MQTTCEKIKILAAKVEKDFRDNSPFYNRFISLARDRYRLKREDAEDVWQNVFLRLTSENSSAMQRYRYEIDETIPIKNDQCLTGYIMIILFNECRDQVRKLKANKRRICNVSLSSLIEEDPGLLTATKKTTYNCMDDLIKKEESTRITELIRTLDAELETVLKLHYFNGMKYEEIASSLEMPIGTVKSRMNRAKRKMIESYKTKIKQIGYYNSCNSPLHLSHTSKVA